MRAYWQGKGGQILSDVIRYERTTMPREEMVTAIDMHLDEIRSNFWGPIDNLKAQANEKLRRCRRCAWSSWSRRPSPRARSSGPSPRDAVGDPGRLDHRRGGRAVRRRGVDPRHAHRDRYMANVGLEFGQNVAEQVFRTGQIGQYKGNPVVQVENFEDFAGNYVLPNDELWIVGRRAGRLTFYGGDAKVQTLQLPSFYLRWETARDAGMLLYGAQKGRIGRIKPTRSAPRPSRAPATRPRRSATRTPSA
jgi:hypothetical protein